MKEGYFHRLEVTWKWSSGVDATHEPASQTNAMPGRRYPLNARRVSTARDAVLPHPGSNAKTAPHGSLRPGTVVASSSAVQGLTRLETAVLIAVARLPHPNHALVIHEDIEMICARPVSVAGVYAALKRLARQHLVAPMWSRPLPYQGGKRKRHFSLSRDGMIWLETEFTEWRRLWWLLPRDITRAWDVPVTSGLQGRAPRPRHPPPVQDARATARRLRG